MTTIEKFHWFWAWDDEKEEAWLRQMSQAGWHLKSVRFPRLYTFEQGEPLDTIYRLDFFTDRKDISNYLQIFQDAGWEYNGEMNGWQYFRKPALVGEMQEIYSDNESKARKYERLLLMLVIFMPIYLHFLRLSSQSQFEIMKIFGLFMAVTLLLYVIAMVKLLQRILQLKKRT